MRPARHGAGAIRARVHLYISGSAAPWMSTASSRWVIAGGSDFTSSVADNGGATGGQCLLSVRSSIMVATLVPMPLKDKSPRLAPRARRGQVTAVEAADDVVAQLARERPDLLIVPMLLHRIGDFAALGLGLLGDLSGLAQLRADLFDALF